MAMVACATCAHPVPSGARFCSSLRHPDRRVLTVALEERRVVTVLFADLVGYTSLAEHLDPENVKRLVESCFERLVADIELFGGRVDKLLGDAIVALFGAPVAHEDDAERAVRAGLRMQETLGRFVEDAGDRSRRSEMRVGINTGEVLVGTLAGSDYTAMGDVVNTASRLQSLAPPGGVLIGSATAALCSPTIGPRAVRRHPACAGASRSSSRGSSPAPRPPVPGPCAATSRSSAGPSERALLDAAVQLVRNGHSGVVSIIGEAGAGKTRLADEIVDAARRRGDRRAHGVRAVRRARRVGAGRRPACRRCSASIPRPVPTTVRPRSSSSGRQELWGLEPGDAELQRYLDASSSCSATRRRSTGSTRPAPATPSPARSPRCCGATPRPA